MIYLIKISYEHTTSPAYLLATYMLYTFVFFYVGELWRRQGQRRKEEEDDDDDDENVVQKQAVVEEDERER